MGSSKGFKASSFLGEYDWSFLCTPRVTFTEQRALAPFYGRDEKISPFLAVIMGLQHALAMVGNLVHNLCALLVLQCQMSWLLRGP